MSSSSVLSDGPVKECDPTHFPSPLAPQSKKEDENSFFSIERINFSIFSSKEIKQLSVAHICSSHLSGEGSVYDPRLGVIENNVLCVTCGLDNHECPGHFGHIELCVPVLHPLFYPKIQDYLNCFCDSCFSFLLTIDQMKLLNLFRYHGNDRFMEICEYIKSKVKSCPKCKEDHSVFVIQEGKVMKYLGDKLTRTNSVNVSIEEVESLLSSVSQETISLLGFENPNVHPLNLVVRNFPVLPLCARPYVENGKGTCDDDLTTKYIEIIKANNKIKKSTKKVDKDEAISSLEFHILTLMNNSKKKARQSNNRPIKCLKERLNGKQGRFRGNLSGKRVDFSARTVIGPEACCRVDEIVIPNEFASKITFPERCFSHNKTHLQSLVDSGHVNTLIRNGVVRNLKFHNHIRAFLSTSTFSFQPGDMVIRETVSMKDGTSIKTRKKIDPWKFFGATQREFELSENDMVVRNGKPLKIQTRQKFILQLGDKVERRGKKIDPEQIRLQKGEFEFDMNDVVYRNGTALPIKFVKNAAPQVQEGDVVERHLRNGDMVLFGRQPTLHIGSLIARKVKVLHQSPDTNGGRPVRTIRFNLADCQTYNADFDGDEMNIIFPQSYQSVAELIHLASTHALIKSGQSSRLLISLRMDALTGGYLLTKGYYQRKIFHERVLLSKDLFFDICCSVPEWSPSDITKRMDHLQTIYDWKCPDEIDSETGHVPLFHGHALLSMLLPQDFQFVYEPNKLKIQHGTILHGYLSKVVLSEGPSSIVHKLEKEYGADIAVNFVSYYSYFVNHYLWNRGFSVGMKDCLPTKETTQMIQNEIQKNLLEAHAIMRSEAHPEFRERKINNCLNNATSVGQKISKEATATENNLNIMIVSGGKGSTVNMSQLTGLLGQQNVDGKRIPKTLGGRTLPFYEKKSCILESDSRSQDTMFELFESRGFISHPYTRGLTAREFFFHASGGREGVIDTAVKTANSGYTQRKFVKTLETMKVDNNGMVTNSVHSVIQFHYGDGFDPARMVNTSVGKSFVNVKNVVEKMNADMERKCALIQE